MNVTETEVWAALSYPDSVVASKKYPPCLNYRRERIGVGAKHVDGQIVVVTVVWASQKLWEQHVEKTGGGHGRSVKPWLNLEGRQ